METELTTKIKMPIFPGFKDTIFEFGFWNDNEIDPWKGFEAVSKELALYFSEWVNESLDCDLLLDAEYVALLRPPEYSILNDEIEIEVTIDLQVMRDLFREIQSELAEMISEESQSLYSPIRDCPEHIREWEPDPEMDPAQITFLLDAMLRECHEDPEDSLFESINGFEVFSNASALPL